MLTGAFLIIEGGEKIYENRVVMRDGQAEVAQVEVGTVSPELEQFGANLFMDSSEDCLDTPNCFGSGDLNLRAKITEGNRGFTAAF